MDQTTHYKLNKPTLDEQYDLSAINDNTDKIDTTMHNIQTELDADEKDLVSKNNALNKRIDETNNALNSEISNRKNAVIDSAHGGSGKTTLKDSANAYIGSLEEGTADIKDATVLIAGSNSGDNGNYYKRKAIYVWGWIKSKISTVLGLTESKYNGTSEKAIKDNSGNTITTEYANKPYANDVLSRYSTTVNIDYATTGNIKLSGVQTIDGISISPQKTVLVKNQTNAKENGIYESSNTTWKRRTAYDTDGELKHKLFRVINGSSNRNKVFYIPTEYFTVGTSNIPFSEYKKIETEQIKDESITSSKIKKGNVTSNELGTDSVTTSKIKNGNVTSDKLGIDSVTSTKVADNTKQMIFDMIMPANKKCVIQLPNEPSPNEMYNGNGIKSTWEDITFQLHHQFLMFDKDRKVGSYTEAGLPEIWGIINSGTNNGLFVTKSWSGDGAFKATNPEVKYFGAIDPYPEQVYTTVDFRASNCSDVYGKNNTVMPQNSSIKLWKRIE